MTAATTEKRSLLTIIQEFSLPLILGVIGAVILATAIGEHDYHSLVEWAPFGENANLFGHKITFHWLMNDVFMVFFFGIAAKEITEAMLPGGALNPPSKALNPLMATLGGVAGPVLAYFILTHLFYGGSPEATLVRNGWGIPTATDIALAWLVARMVFGAQHPAVNFLLLLAIVDDAIGLIIIAVFYPNPAHPVAPEWLLLAVVGMGVAYLLRRKGVKNWVPYIVLAGVVSWFGFLKASLHPALALVPIIPFLPAGHRNEELFVEEQEDQVDAHDHSTLDDFEHSLKKFVDFGLFFFGMTNAGVAISMGAITHPVTLIVFGALIIGKMVGIAFFAGIGNAIGFKYPEGMGFRHTVVAGIVAGIGLTVALFVAGEAFPITDGGGHGADHGETAELVEGDEDGVDADAAEPLVAAADVDVDGEHAGEAEPNYGAYQAPAKMGSLLSAFAALLALIVGRILKVKELQKS